MSPNGGRPVEVVPRGAPGQAAGEDRAPPRSRRGNDAVDPAPCRSPGRASDGLERFDADRPADARSLVVPRTRASGLSRAPSTATDEILPTYELAAAHPLRLEERHVQVPGLDPAVQLRTLRPWREPDPQLQLLELAEDLRQGGQGEVVRHPDACGRSARTGGEVTHCLVVGGEDRPGQTVASPSAVNATIRVSRTNSARPTASSSLRTWTLTVGCRTPREAAAGEAQRLADRESCAAVVGRTWTRPYSRAYARGAGLITLRNCAACADHNDPLEHNSGDPLCSDAPSRPPFLRHSALCPLTTSASLSHRSSSPTRGLGPAHRSGLVGA
jgi:hypothetical protein